MKTVGINNVGSPKGPNQPFSTERDAALRSIYWVPVGFAAAVSLGDTSSPLVILPVLALLALVHSRAPAALSIIVGLGALLVSLASAVGASYDAGYTIPLLLAGYGGTVALMVFVSMIGGAGREKVARQLLVAVAAIELALFTLSPIGKVPEGFGPATALLAVLLVATVVAGASDFGYFVTATALLAVLIVLAVAGSPYGHSSPLVLAGTLLFAQLGVLFTLRKEDDERPELLAANDNWHAAR
jgi:hypothetical protein